MTGRGDELPIETIRAIRQMRQDGMGWQAVARATGISDERIRRQVDPGYADRRQEQIRANRARGGGGERATKRLLIDTLAARQDGLRLLQSVPADTRKLTARLLGDPLPGRSALDKRSLR